jgi:catechol 2,3-dioxygenase-like lactoylglutathione lyase family enzyme
VALILNHTIVPAKDRHEAANWFAQIFGLKQGPAGGHFAPVQVNDTLTFLFAENSSFEGHHYAFLVSGAEFDSILERVRSRGLTFGSAPWSRDDGKLNDWDGGRGVYFESPDGHLFELMTEPQRSH